MSVLAEIVRNILAIIILASFLELLLPEGSIRPFVRFAIGLFVLIAVLTPLFGYFFKDSSFQIQWWDHQMEADWVNEMAARGQEINQDILDQNGLLLKEKLEGQINAVVLLVPGVEEVNTEAFLSQGSLAKLSFSIAPEELEEEGLGLGLNQSGIQDDSQKESIETKVRKVVSNMYGLGQEQIEINFEGGKKDVGRMDPGKSQ